MEHILLDGAIRVSENGDFPNGDRIALLVVYPVLASSSVFARSPGL
jgi:hypothetical protein